MNTQQRRRHREERPNKSQNRREERLANGLGWFSIGLGVAEVVAPGKVAELIGVRDSDRTRTVLRTYGLRELAAGIGILTQPRPAGWLWGRVAGDIVDLASLGKALGSGDSSRARVAAATVAVLGVTALDVLCGQQLSRGTNGRKTSRGAPQKNDTGRITKTLVINRPPDEVYRFWHDFEKLPTFMSYLESVQVTGDGRSHWKAKAPGGASFEWDAEITADEPNRRIAWRSVGASDLENSGSVSFERAAGDRGTLLRVEMQLAPTGGSISSKIAKLFGSVPEQLIEQDLRALKQILETGEIVKSDASIHRGMHPARPPGREEMQQSRTMSPGLGEPVHS